MKQEIRLYGDAVLRKAATPVAEVNDEIRRLVDDLLETMYARQGLGLAAEQIGRTEAVCVIDIPPEAESERAGNAPVASRVAMPLILLNPEITEKEGEQVGQEGCLSFPEIYVTVKRAEKVTVAYRSLDNELHTVETDGLLARAIQHELDHLHGVLLVDRMSPVKRVSLSGKLKRLRKEAAA